MPSRNKSKWTGIEPGFYLVPLPFVQTNVQLSSNNKTDSLIKSDQTIKMLQYAKKEGLFLPLPYLYTWGEGKRISLWKVGEAAIVPYSR